MAAKGFQLNKTLLISFLIVFFVACTPQVATSIVNDTPTWTVVPSASVTLKPTETDVPTATASPTSRPPDFILESPNGEFVAEFDNANRHPATEKQVIEIFDKDGSLLWEIPYQHVTALVDPHPSLHIYGWSKDSTYLYFHYIFSPDGGDFAFWWDGFDLQRINVQTGEIEKVIPGDGSVAFAFSPDESQIAYTRRQDNPSIIYVRELSTGFEKAAYVIFGAKNYVRVGDIRWSPTGTEIAFQTETDDYMVQTIFLNPVTMKQKVIREYEMFTLLFDGWTEDGKLQFSEISANGMRIDNVFQVDVANSATLVIGTPTPQP